MRKTFFHIHVPKTAGWMFWDILEQNFKGLMKADYPSPSFEYFAPEGIEWALRQYRYTCYTSHAIRLSSIPVLSNHQMVACSFVRDPVKRILSSYFYCRMIPETGSWHPSKTMYLNEFLDAMLNDPEYTRLPLDISQEAYIRGSQPSRSLESIVKQDFGKYHLFPTERFDDALICLEKLYPDEFRDCSYGERSNTSKKDQEVTTEDLDKIEQLPWIAKDRALHAFAHEQINSLMEELFPDEVSVAAAREDFAERCKSKREAKPDFQNKAPISRRIRSAVQTIFKG